MASTRAASVVVRLRHLEALRDRQADSERKAELALAASRGELLRLREANTQSVESAERELVELTEGLQQSLRAQSELEGRLFEAEAEESELAAERDLAQAARDRFVEELRSAAEEYREWDATLATERAEKERLIRALHERRLAAGPLEADAAAAEMARGALQKEVERLREIVARAHRLDRAEEAVRSASGRRLLRHVLRSFAVGIRSARTERLQLELFFRRRRRLALLEAWRWLRHVGRSALKAARVRRFVGEAVSLRVLRDWSLIASEAHWAKQRTHTAEAQRNAWLRRYVLCAWLAGARSVAAADRAVSLRRLGKAVLQRWHEESAASAWDRWVAARCRRRWQWLVLRRCINCWRRHARRTVYWRRASTVLASRRRPRRAQSILRSWAGHCGSLAAAAATQRQRRWRTLGRCWRSWRQCCTILRYLRRRSAADRHRLLSRAFGLAGTGGFLGHVRRNASLRSLSRARWTREALAVIRRALPLWAAMAGGQRALKLNAWVLMRRRISNELAWWHFVTRRQRRFRLLPGVSATASTRRASRHRAARFAEWARLIAMRRFWRERLGAIRWRSRAAVLRPAWRSWLRVARRAAIERAAELQAEIEEFAVATSEMEDQLASVKGARAAVELDRLRFMDEVHEVAQEVAALTVDHREAARSERALERLAVEERDAAEGFQAEAAELRAERDEMAALRSARRLMIEEQLSSALEAPTALRAELRASEAQARAAAVEENEARHETVILHEELEELQRTATWRLELRDEEAAALRLDVSAARRSVQELNEAVELQQATLRSQEKRLQRQRQQDVVRDLEMYVPFKP